MLALLWFGAVQISAGQSLGSFAPWRLFGTNLFDFTDVAVVKSRNLHPDWVGDYWAQGEVAAVLDSGVYVIQDLGVRYKYAPSEAVLDYGNTSDLLNMAVAGRLARRDGTIGIGHYLALSPSGRLNYQPIRAYHSFVVTNCPAHLRRKGASIRVIVLRAGQATVRLKDGGTSIVERYDFGEPFRGDLDQHPSYFKVTPIGVLRAHHKTKSDKIAAVAKVVEFQKRRAEEGSDESQYLLGMRYLIGSGVEQDRVEAKKWLQKSANQGYQPAIRKLNDL